MDHDGVTAGAGSPMERAGRTRRVAQLVATGLTNRDVAQALFVTARTVEVHLSNVYRKLGISSRTELPPGL
jgi:DNA-binding NarL/FixJ family response regulator